MSRVSHTWWRPVHRVSGRWDRGGGALVSMAGSGWDFHPVLDGIRIVSNICFQSTGDMIGAERIESLSWEKRRWAPAGAPPTGALTGAGATQPASQISTVPSKHLREEMKRPPGPRACDIRGTTYYQHASHSLTSRSNCVSKYINNCVSIV